MLKKLSTFIDFSIPTERKSSSNDNQKYCKTSDGFDFLQLVHAWSEIAGPKLAEHTVPLKNQNGTLTILSNHSAFASEMKFMETPLKKKIFLKFPNLEKAIKTINFIVDSTHFSKQMEIIRVISKKNKSEIKIPHAFSPEFKLLQKEADELFKNVLDEELKKSLSSLYIQSKFNSAK